MAVYTEFLKLSMEYDYSEDLGTFRKALGVVVKVMGPGQVAKLTGLNRVTLSGYSEGVETLGFVT